MANAAHEYHGVHTFSGHTGQRKRAPSGPLSPLAGTRSLRRAQQAAGLPTLARASSRTLRSNAGTEHTTAVIGSFDLMSDTDGLAPYMTSNKMHFPVVTQERIGDGAAQLEAMAPIGMLDYENIAGPTGDDVRRVREYERLFRRRGGLREATDADAAATEAQQAAEYSKFMSREDMDRLRELDRVFKSGDDIPIEEILKQKHSLGAAVKMRLPKTMAGRLQKSPLLYEANRLGRVLQLRGSKGKKIMAKFSSRKTAAVRSDGLDRLGERYRQEQRAAIIIQRSVRKYMRIAYWKRVKKFMDAATEVQRMFKGHRIRRWFRAYIARRHGAAAQIQALARGHAARKLLAEMRTERKFAAIEIQRGVRYFLYKCHLYYRRRERAALTIQVVWRGAVARGQVYRRYLDAEVTAIQAKARAWLQRKRYLRALHIEADAAITIQTAFRAYLARCKRNVMLWERSLQQRRDWMRQLQSEDQYFKQRALKAVEQKQRTNFDAKITQGMLEFSNLEDEIYLLEFDLVNIQNEQAKLSPRGLQQGWARQLLLDMDKYRKEVTAFKAKALFQVARQLRQNQRTKLRLEARAAHAMQRQTAHQLQYVAERNLLNQRLNEMDWGSRKVLFAKALADEKRKWQVQYTTQSGKVDLTRPPVRAHWDMEQFALRQSRTWSTKASDYMAFTKPDIPNQEDAFAQARQREVMLRHAAEMFGTHDAIGIDEAEHYAPDVLPFPMTHEEVEDGVLTDTLPRGAAASAEYAHAGMWRADGSAVMTPAVQAGRVPQPPPEARVGLRRPRLAHPDGAPAVRGGHVGPDGMWVPLPPRPGDSIASVLHTADPSAGYGQLAALSEPTLGPYGEPQGPPGIVPATYMASAGVASHVATRQTDAGDLGLGEVSPTRGLPQHLQGAAGRLQTPADSSLPELRPGTVAAPRDRPDTQVGHGPGQAEQSKLLEDTRPASSAAVVESHVSRPLSAIVLTELQEEFAAADRQKARAEQKEVAPPAGLDADGNLIATHAAHKQFKANVQDYRNKNRMARFAGTGHNEAIDESMPAPDTDLQRAVGAARGVLDHADSASIHSSVVSVDGYGAMATNDILVAEAMSLAQSLGQGSTGARALPAYIVCQLAAASKQEISAMNTEVRELQRKQAKAALLRAQKARLPPGLLGAREAQAASEQASAKAHGHVGRTQVRTDREERMANALAELKSFSVVGDRVARLVDKMGALSGQMEMVQYGALTKPLFSAMNKFSSKLGAGADGPVVPPPPGAVAEGDDDPGLSKSTVDIPTRQGFNDAGGLGPEKVDFTRNDGGHFVAPRAPTPPRITSPGRRSSPLARRSGGRAGTAAAAAATAAMGASASGSIGQLSDWPTRSRPSSPVRAASPSRGQRASQHDSDLVDAMWRKHQARQSGSSAHQARDARLESLRASHKRVLQRHQPYKSAIDWSLLDALEEDTAALAQEQQRRARIKPDPATLQVAASPKKLQQAQQHGSVVLPQHESDSEVPDTFSGLSSDSDSVDGDSEAGEGSGESE